MSYTSKDGAEGSNFKQLLMLLLLAFTLPLLCAMLIMNTALFRSGAFNLIAYGVEAAAPSLAAVLTVLCFEKGRGLRQFLKRSYIDNLNLNTFLVALFLPFAVVAAPKMLYWMISGSTPSFVMLSQKKTLIVCWALIAEELGWRGFLQEKLRNHFNDFTLPLMLGLIWAAWHYHYFLSGAMSVPIILFTLGCVTDSYIYYALTKSVNGNIVPASVFHFSGNLCFNLFLINPEYNNGSAMPYLLYVICSLIAAVIAALVTYTHRVKM